MKKNVAITVLAAVLALSSQEIFATPVLTDNFNSYTDGNLVGQGNWGQTGVSATTPVQVNSGVVTIGSSGQDIYDPFSSAVTLANGQSMYFGLTLDVSAAQTTGDYFMHFTPNAANSSLFYDRVFVKSTTGGYLLGLLGTSGGSAATYGTTVLSLDTSYNIVVAYNFSSATPTNSTDSIFVNPTDPAVGNNTAYLNDIAWGSASVDTNMIAAVNFRQGSSSSAPTLTVDNLVVSESFADVVPTPEPSTIALLTLGGVAGLAAIRRKR